MSQYTEPQYTEPQYTEPQYTEASITIGRDRHAWSDSCVTRDGKKFIYLSMLFVNSYMYSYSLNIYDLVNDNTQLYNDSFNILNYEDEDNSKIFSVAASYDGNTVAIGVIEYVYEFKNSGQVKIYKYNTLNDTYANVQTIKYDDDNNTDDLFGSSVALSSNGNRLAVRSKFDVRIYDYNINNSKYGLDGDNDYHNSFSIAGNDRLIEKTIALSDDGNKLVYYSRYTETIYTRLYDTNASTWSEFAIELKLSEDEINENDKKYLFSGSLILSGNGTKLAVDRYDQDASVPNILDKKKSQINIPGNSLNKTHTVYIFDWNNTNKNWDNTNVNTLNSFQESPVEVETVSYDQSTNNIFIPNKGDDVDESSPIVMPPFINKSFDTYGNRISIMNLVIKIVQDSRSDSADPEYNSYAYDMLKYITVYDIKVQEEMLIFTEYLSKHVHERCVSNTLMRFTEKIVYYDVFTGVESDRPFFSQGNISMSENGSKVAYYESNNNYQIYSTTNVTSEPEPGPEEEQDVAIQSNICFPSNEKVLTDQGILNIQDVTKKNTICGNNVLLLTKTKTYEKHLIMIRKDAFYPNIPNKDTKISMEHKVMYQGKLIESKKLLGKKEGVEKIEYNNESMYNICIDNEIPMVVNGMYCESLSIHNRIYKLLQTPTKESTIKVKSNKKLFKITKGVNKYNMVVGKNRFGYKPRIQK